MRVQQKMVREFLLKHLGADQDAPNWPVRTGRYNKWLLIAEEGDELFDALNFGDYPYHGHLPETFDEVKAVDAICDLLYVIFNLCEELHIDIEPFFNEVHLSNMTKTPGALSPTKKIMKGPDFKPPRIADMLAAYRQLGSPTEGADKQ